VPERRRRRHRTRHGRGLAVPANPVYQYHLGLAYSRTEDPTRAREFLEAALRLKPDFAGAADARTILSTLE
jgi:hypothetical protein